jgi:hypothetical protein
MFKRSVFFPDKNVFFWFVLGVFTLGLSCRSEKSTYSKINNLISGYMKSNLHDYSSYESVETSYEFGDVLVDRIAAAANMRAEKQLIDSLTLSSRYSSLNKEVNRVVVDSLILGRRSIRGWNVYHRYRAKNSFGATVLSQIMFVIDSQQTRILRVIEDEDDFAYPLDVGFNNTNDLPSDFTIHSEDLLREFIIDDAGANRKYLEKVVVVYGKPTAIEIRADSIIIIKFTDRHGSNILFSIEKHQIDSVKNIPPGTNISVKGVCSGSIYSEILSTTSINFKRSILIDPSL